MAESSFLFIASQLLGTDCAEIDKKDAGCSTMKLLNSRPCLLLASQVRLG